MNRRIIVFAPHPDDETLGCGGTIARKTNEGYEVVVVVMTDGRHALKSLGISSPTPEELRIIRREEITKAIGCLGVSDQNLLFLDFVDGTLGEHVQEAVKKVRVLLKEYSPSEVYFPHAKDINVDHQAASFIVNGSIAEMGLSVSGYRYSVFQRFARVGPIVDRVLSVFKRNLVYVDVSSFLRQKEAALGEYKSQTTIISGEQEKPVVENVHRFLKSNEVFYLH